MFPLILDSKEQLNNWSSFEGDARYAIISKDDLLEHIELGANLLETSVNGNSFMHLAVEKGWQEVVEKLIKVDETLLNVQGNRGYTPLMCYTGDRVGKNSGIVRFLLEQGANPKIVDVDGWNILHYSCCFGDLQGNHLFILTKLWVGWYFFFLFFFEYFTEFTVVCLK